MIATTTWGKAWSYAHASFVDSAMQHLEFVLCETNRSKLENMKTEPNNTHVLTLK